MTLPLIDEVFAAPTAAEQGQRFEMLARWILENSPEYRDRFSNVWSWADSPLYDGPDMGIDLIARLSDGSGHWAVQCKALRGAVTKRGVDSFLAASPRDRYGYRLLVATTDDLSVNARRASQQLALGIERLGAPR